MFTNKARLFVISACTLFALTAATPAFAQQGESSSNTQTSGQQTGSQSTGAQGGTQPMGGGPDMDPRVFVFGNLAFGGEIEPEIETETTVNGQTNTNTTDGQQADMETSNAFGVHFGVPVHRFFTVGGRVSYVSYITEALDQQDFDRLGLLNIDAAPKARYTLAGGSAEIYATVPVGVTLNFPNQDLQDTIGDNAEYNTTVSWNISLLGGASYKFTDSIGVFAEGGLYNQNVKWVAKGSSQNTEATVTTTGSFAQFGMLAGAFFSF